jgi:hypothetical protein
VRETRAQQVLRRLREADGEWVDGSELATAEVGGSEGLKRLRELRAAGEPIEERRHPDPRRAVWQYRLSPQTTYGIGGTVTKSHVEPDGTRVIEGITLHEVSVLSPLRGEPPKAAQTAPCPKCNRLTQVTPGMVPGHYMGRCAPCKSSFQVRLP